MATKQLLSTCMRNKILIQNTRSQSCDYPLAYDNDVTKNSKTDSLLS